MNQLRILLADDHAVVREGLCTLIDSQSDMHVVADVACGEDALTYIDSHPVDIAILDVAMPGIGGIKTAALLVEHPATKILVLSGYDDPHYLRELLRIGVSGYVLKRAAAEAIIQAIRTIAAGGMFLDPNLVAALPNLEQPAHHEYQYAVEKLSDRELEVVQRIAQGYSNKEVAHALEISVKTVETYKARAMQKLELQSRVDLVHYAVRAGWLH